MSNRIQCYLVGRSAHRADIVIDDSDCTISSLHAELVYSADGRWYLNDCASANGTYVHRNGRWQALRQDFIAPGERLRFGGFEVGADWLIQQAQLREQSGMRYLRDPATGELHPHPDT